MTQPAAVGYHCQPVTAPQRMFCSQHLIVPIFVRLAQGGTLYIRCLPAALRGISAASAPSSVCVIHASPPVCRRASATARGAEQQGQRSC